MKKSRSKSILLLGLCALLIASWVPLSSSSELKDNAEASDVQTDIEHWLQQFQDSLQQPLQDQGQLLLNRRPFNSPPDMRREIKIESQRAQPWNEATRQLSRPCLATSDDPACQVARRIAELPPCRRAADCEARKMFINKIGEPNLSLAQPQPNEPAPAEQP